MDDAKLDKAGEILWELEKDEKNGTSKVSDAIGMDLKKCQDLVEEGMRKLEGTIFTIEQVRELYLSAALQSGFSGDSERFRKNLEEVYPTLESVITLTKKAIQAKETHGTIQTLNAMSMD